MENSSIFSDKTTEWFGPFGLPALSLWEAVPIVTVVFLLLAAILWIALRKARLWYWKTDVQIDTLKNIETRLKNVEEKVSQSPNTLMETTEEEVPVGEAVAPPNELVAQETSLCDDGFTAIGKSGRVYTEAELEMQIRE